MGQEARFSTQTPFVAPDELRIRKLLVNAVIGEVEFGVTPRADVLQFAYREFAPSLSEYEYNACVFGGRTA
jgi:hypothetical protein